MTPALDHKQHRSGRRWGWASPVAAANAVHISVARDKAQSGAHPRPVSVAGWITPVTTLFLPVRTCRGFGSGIFPKFERICELTGRQPVLARSRCNVGHHVIYHAFDVPKAYHLERLSSGAGFDDQQPSERITHRVGSFTQGLGNV